MGLHQRRHQQRCWSLPLQSLSWTTSRSLDLKLVSMAVPLQTHSKSERIALEFGEKRKHGRGECVAQIIDAMHNKAQTYCTSARRVHGRPAGKRSRRIHLCRPSSRRRTPRGTPSCGLDNRQFGTLSFCQSKPRKDPDTYAHTVVKFHQHSNECSPYHRP